MKNGLKNLQGQLKNVKDPVQKARLEAALKAIGTEGDHNGVAVQFGKTLGGGAGETTPFNDPQTYKETYTVTLDPNMLKGENDYAIAGAHEGTHIDDLNTELANPNGTILSPFSLEYRGYQTSAFAASALGQSSTLFSLLAPWPHPAALEFPAHGQTTVPQNVPNCARKFI